MDIKIGDKVRFLNDVGGGTITGFQGKDLVLVTDNDGFEIPTLRTEVIVVETDDYNIAKVAKASLKKAAANGEADNAPTSVKSILNADSEEDDEPETDLADKEITYKPLAHERRGADELNLLLAFVPVGGTAASGSKFSMYLINDCNYTVRYSLLTYSGEVCHLRHEGEIAPNTKTLLEEIKRNDLEQLQHLTVQAIAFKTEKPFAPKPALSVNLRIDAARFFKQNAFKPNDFFNENALVMDVVKDDRAARSMFVDADQLREAMQSAHSPARLDVPAANGAERRASQKQQRQTAIEVDLHADSLFDTMAGLSPKDILEYQIKVVRDTLNAHAKHRGQRIVFIHGKGEGVLRNALLKELRTHYKQCRVQDASFQEYGYGATMITM